MVAPILGLVHLAAGLPFTYRPLLAWWFVIAAVSGVMVMQARFALWRTLVGGAVTVAVLALLLAVFGGGTTDRLDHPRDFITPALRRAVAELVAEPDVSSRTWAAAVDQLPFVAPHSCSIRASPRSHRSRPCGTVALRPSAPSPCTTVRRRASQLPWRTVTNRAFEGLLYDFWAGRWIKSDGSIG